MSLKTEGLPGKSYKSFANTCVYRTPASMLSMLCFLPKGLITDYTMFSMSRASPAPNNNNQKKQYS